jgi:hypothetical protein
MSACLDIDSPFSGGFERELSPGASVDERRVIAYTADASDLVTIESKKAKTAGLKRSGCRLRSSSTRTGVSSLRRRDQPNGRARTA